MEVIIINFLNNSLLSALVKFPRELADSLNNFPHRPRRLYSYPVTWLVYKRLPRPGWCTSRSSFCQIPDNKWRMNLNEHTFLVTTLGRCTDMIKSFNLAGAQIMRICSVVLSFGSPPDSCRPVPAPVSALFDPRRPLITEAKQIASRDNWCPRNIIGYLSRTPRTQQSYGSH